MCDQGNGFSGDGDRFEYRHLSAYYSTDFNKVGMRPQTCEHILFYFCFTQSQIVWIGFVATIELEPCDLFSNIVQP